MCIIERRPYQHDIDLDLIIRHHVSLDKKYVIFTLLLLLIIIIICKKNSFTSTFLKKYIESLIKKCFCIH